MTTATLAPATERASVRPIRVIITVVLCLAVVVLLVWQRQRLAGLPDLLADANWGWIAVGIVAQVASIGALAREQRLLISVRGGRRPLPSVIATTWAGNAISVSLPLVGSAAAAVFVYKRFTSIGVDRTVAAWALAISGVYSTVSFAAIAAVGAIISGSPGLAITGVIAVLAGVLPACLILIGLRRPRVHHAAITAIAYVLRLSQRLFRRPKGNADQMSSSTLDQLTTLRLSKSHTVIVSFEAVINWIFDLTCLACAIMAVHGTVPWHGLILAWAAGSSVSSLGLTPGGLGVVEIALGTALIGVGLPAGAAIAAALLYRAVKLGLVFAIGGITLLVIRWTTAREVIAPGAPLLAD
ncbi:uncharacterized membrane protein YbhN (UPF0104 family) [Nakamurella sp. UYEF19]|uniref:lysylphosphatidylglycerol synthase transmembrane domain-containing protein n=1 Tax=Nakamurella sp. UYEF19 TaxID=1756392 RepID=UPI003394B477